MVQSQVRNFTSNFPTFPVVLNNLLKMITAHVHVQFPPVLGTKPHYHEPHFQFIFVHSQTNSVDVTFSCNQVVYSSSWFIYSSNLSLQQRNTVENISRMKHTKKILTYTANVRTRVQIYHCKSQPDKFYATLFCRIKIFLRKLS